jgi:RNA polymerase sigma factor (sigma-70 family)
VLRLLHSYRNEAAQGSQSDGDLLRRFVDIRDEVAFEILVWRYGPAVLNLCRRVLLNPHDAEDAFQATFLMLVLKAASVRNKASLGSWLYKVALRIALEARERCAARARRERHDLEFPSADADDPAQDKEQRHILHEEINRLPERYRLPVILCYLSGQSTEQAAQALGCPRGTVLSRLATARQRLYRRLVQRGVSLSTSGLVLILGAMASQASTVLVRSTVKAAASVAAGKVGPTGVAASVLMLIEGVLNAMYWTKIKTTVAVVLLLGALLLGFGLLSRQQVTAEPRTERKNDQPAQAAEEIQPEPKKILLDRPSGTWEKQVEGSHHVTLRFEGDRMFVKFTSLSKDDPIVFQGDADFSITKEAILFGVVTGVEFDGDNDSNPAEVEQAVIDVAFSLRYRIDDNVMTIKHIKVGVKEEGGVGEIESMLMGRYKRKKEGVAQEPAPAPRPRAKKARTPPTQAM